MATTQEDEWSEPYQRADLPKEDHDPLVAELRADPQLLRNLLRQTTQEDEALSASLLFGQTGIADHEALDERLRSYLLRDQTLTQEDIALLEESLIEDERYFDRMLLVENELIEDYLRGALPAEEEQRFNTHFLVTPERQEKLRYLRALAMATPVAPLEKVRQPARATSSGWRSLLAFVRPPNLLTAAVAATVVLFLIFGALLWLIRRASQHEPLLAEEPIKQATQNTSPSPSPATAPVSPAPASPPRNEQSPQPGQSVRPTPSKPTRPASPPTVFALVSGVLRGGGGGAEKRIEPGSEFVELYLRLDLEGDYSDFRITIEDSNGREVARRGRLKATTKGGLSTVVASFPAALFKPDDYMVILSGETNSGYKEVGRYSFRVLK